MTVALTAAETAEAYALLAELSNCTITEVARPGRLAANGDSTPDPVWRGSVRGFRRSERRLSDLRSTAGDGIQDADIVETVRIYDAVGGAALYMSGADHQADSIVIDGRRWTIRGAIRDQHQTLDSWLLELGNERAA